MDYVNNSPFAVYKPRTADIQNLGGALFLQAVFYENLILEIVAQNLNYFSPNEASFHSKKKHQLVSHTSGSNRDLWRLKPVIYPLNDLGTDLMDTCKTGE